MIDCKHREGSFVSCESYGAGDWAGWTGSMFSGRVWSLWWEEKNVAHQVNLEIKDGIMELLSSFRWFTSCFSDEGDSQVDVEIRAEEWLETSAFGVRSESLGKYETAVQTGFINFAFTITLSPT